MLTPQVSELGSLLAHVQDRSFPESSYQPGAMSEGCIVIYIVA